MNKENCALKLVDEIILYYDARSKKYQFIWNLCLRIFVNTFAPSEENYKRLFMFVQATHTHTWLKNFYTPFPWQPPLRLSIVLFCKEIFLSVFLCVFPRIFVSISVNILNKNFSFLLSILFANCTLVTLYIAQHFAFVSVPFLRQRNISYIMIGFSSGRHTFALMLTLLLF